MTEDLRNITPELVDGPSDEFVTKVKAIQDEIAAYIDKTYPVTLTDSKETRKVLNMTLGTVLIGIGITKVKDSGTNPLAFLQDIIKQAVADALLADLLGKFNPKTKE